MQNKKRFVLEEKEHFYFYLLELIGRVDQRLRRYNRYIVELKKIIDDNKIISDVNMVIPAYLYEDISDKIMHTEKVLLNLFGDYSKSAVSYYKFRDLLDEKIKDNNPEFKDIGLLEDEFKTYLKKMHDLRNWTLHVPESLLVVAYEKLKEMRHPLPTIKTNNRVNLLSIENYDSRCLWGLYELSQESYDIMQKLFQRMKKDYSEILGEPVIFEENRLEIPYSFNSPDVEITDKSWKIQTGKLKDNGNKNKEL